MAETLSSNAMNYLGTRPQPTPLLACMTDV